jgi:hypothetical protein
MRRKLKLSFHGGDSGIKKYRRGYDVRSGVWLSLRLKGVWILESGGRICLDAFDSSMCFYVFLIGIGINRDYFIKQL